MQILEDLGEAIRPDGVSVVDVLLAIAVVALAFPAARLVERIVRAGVRKVPNLSSESATVIAYGSRYITLFLFASMALNLVGVNVGWALALAILSVIVVLLTLRPLVENAAAGFLLKSRPSFAVGDEVEFSGHIGEVISISARTTVLRTRDGVRVHIPNTDVLDHEIIVLTAFSARRLSVALNIDQHCDLDHVSGVLTRAVEALPIVKEDPPTTVSVDSLDSGAVGLLVQFWFEPQAHTERAATNAAARSIHAALRDMEIELLPPLRRLEAANSPPRMLMTEPRPQDES